MLGISLLKKKSFSFCIQMLPKFLCLGFLYSVTSAFIDIIFYIQIFKIKVEKFEKLKWVLILGTSKCLTYLIIPSQYSCLIDLPIIFCFIKFVMKQSNEKAILGETLNVTVSVIIERTFYEILNLIFKSSYGEIIYNFTYMIIFTVSVIISKTVFVFVVNKKNSYIPFSNHLKSRNKRSIYIISFLGLAIVITAQYEVIYYDGILEYVNFLVKMGAYFYACLKTISIVNNIEVQELKISSLEAYNKNLSLMYDSIRGFKHDFSNFVLALDGYVETENMSGIKSMSKAILQDCKSINKMEVLDPNIINNSAIYSMITNKYYLAKEQNLTINIEVLSKIDEHTENNYEICRILGILLDNAIEAAKETEEKIINIKFEENQTPKRSLVIVENSYKNKSIDVEKIFEKGYTSKECFPRDHGLGLWNIKNILVNNEKLNLYTTAGKLFRQQLEIY